MELYEAIFASFLDQVFEVGAILHKCNVHGLVPCTDTGWAGSPGGPPHQLYHLTNSEATTPRRVDIFIQEVDEIYYLLLRSFWLT